MKDLSPNSPVYHDTPYAKGILVHEAERDLQLVQDMAAEMHYGALPKAWQHVYNLLIELDRAYGPSKLCPGRPDPSMAFNKWYGDHNVGWRSNYELARAAWEAAMTCPCWTDPAYVAKNAYCEACDPNRPARMTDVAARLLEMADEPLELHGLSMTDEQDALLREAAALLREAIVWKAR